MGRGGRDPQKSLVRKDLIDGYQEDLNEEGLVAEHLSN